MNIVEFLEAIGPVARVALLSGLAIIVVLATGRIVEWMGWTDNDATDIQQLIANAKRRQMELAAVTTRQPPAGPLARSLAHTQAATGQLQGHSYPPYGRF